MVVPISTDRPPARIGPPLIVLLVGLAIGAGPLVLGPPGGDDAYYHAMYALEHARCWRGGVLFPSWYPDLNAGLGGPEPRARPQLPLALHAAFALVLDDAVAATSLATAIIPIAAGLLMFAVARRRGVSPAGAVVPALVWSAAPYLLVTLHERGALQEAWATALLPWVLDRLLPPAPATRRAMLGASLAFGVLLATQLLVAYMAALTVVVAHALSRRRQPARLAAALALGLGIAAWSWLPNVIGLRRLQAGLFTSGWFDWRRRFLLSTTDPAPVLNARMVLVALAVLGGAALLLTVAGRSRALAAGAMGTVLLATPLARPVWELAPGIALLQFPWRWLGLASALVAVALAEPMRKRAANVSGLLLVLPAVVALASPPRLDPGPPLRPSDPAAKAAQAATRYGVPPILPPFPAMLPRGTNLTEALQAAREARPRLPAPAQSGPREWSWRLEGASSEIVVLPLLADDGWRVRLDGVRVPWHPSRSLVSVVVPANAHTVTAIQAMLPESIVGAVVTAMVIVAWLWLRRRGRG